MWSIGCCTLGWEKILREKKIHRKSESKLSRTFIQPTNTYKHIHKTWLLILIAKVKLIKPIESQASQRKKERKRYEKIYRQYIRVEEIYKLITEEERQRERELSFQQRAPRKKEWERKTKKKKLTKRHGI